ncbi:hypothetical protein A8F94_08625 [Bacillus sp. FJAT-27225]|uniref:polysaccharide lyase n=1 Tax=Bacillus sp. FJAT-27225 TaxID=1743144 RepID=UPI00080C329F|nr:polysaccharide lyase [Bacillus sp. FJAT-27225]OCA87888.1 hypothetical protein A8F94_08625 [Bacillus sp. FJAT-27225]
MFSDAINNEKLEIYVDGFEDSTLRAYWTQHTAGLPYSLTLDPTVKKSGKQSLRFELNKSDPPSNVGSHRSEIHFLDEEPLEEHWYGFSIYLPDDGEENFSYDTEPEILVQWHANPDIGEAEVSPPLSLQTHKGRYVIVQRWEDDPITEQNKLPIFTKDLGDYAPDKGKWVNWVFHVKWGWLPEQNPITEVYKNGKLVYKRNGHPNTYNDKKGVYQKLGIYKWPWDDPNNGSISSKRVVYFDNFWRK